VRAIHLVPAAIIAPFAVLHLTRTLTGEPLSAVILTLPLFITLAALCAGAAPPGAPRQAPSGRRGARP
jgi:hypothetical protein